MMKPNIVGIKHRPETPLPWEEFSKVDAAYIAHAANAYPKLVEFVRGIASENKHAIGSNAEAILRELGENL